MFVPLLIRLVTSFRKVLSEVLEGAPQSIGTNWSFVLLSKAAEG